MIQQLTERQQRRRASHKILKAIMRGWAKIKQTRPAKDEDYLAWLRTQSCAIEECLSVNGFKPEDMIEAAHVGAIRGLRQKCSDREAIPLCAYHHRIGAVSHHVLGKTFWIYWGMNREEEIEKYNALYEQERAG